MTVSCDKNIIKLKNNKTIRITIILHAAQSTKHA